MGRKKKMLFRETRDQEWILYVSRYEKLGGGRRNGAELRTLRTARVCDKEVKGKRLKEDETMAVVMVPGLTVFVLGGVALSIKSTPLINSIAFSL